VAEQQIRDNLSFNRSPDDNSQPSTLHCRFRFDLFNLRMAWHLTARRCGHYHVGWRRLDE
jgi:hypothetical protein